MTLHVDLYHIKRLAQSSKRMLLPYRSANLVGPLTRIIGFTQCEYV